MLDDILRERFVPEMPSNMAYRIIDAAKPRGAVKNSTAPGFWRAFSEMFLIPQPVFAMLVVLVIGLGAGNYYTTEQAMTTTMASENFSSFITADLSVDYGDF